jgi:coniferyl-aldehyde dehydrogenase
MNDKSKITEAERFGGILAAQRAAFLLDGPPSLEQRRASLNKFRSALLARREAIEDAINNDFGNRSRHGNHGGVWRCRRY